MLMSSVAEASKHVAYPELAGARAVVFGADSGAGIACASALADHAARLVVQGGAATLDVEAVHQRLAGVASALSCMAQDADSSEAAIRLTQQAAAVFSGIEVMINVTSLDAEDVQHAILADRIEDLIADKLSIAVEIGRVAANRMSLTRTEGLVVQVLDYPANTTGAQAMVARLLKAAFSASVRREAERLASLAVRVNLVAPCLATLPGEPDDETQQHEAMAALVLLLASAQGRTLSGLALEADACAERLLHAGDCGSSQLVDSRRIG